MKILVASTVPALFFATHAFGECSNLVLNMKDTKSGREITTLLDCHDASATIPGATTMHFMEWKNGRLCQSIQNCGNVNFWKGTLSVGANWYWGDSLTKFKQTTDSWNSFAQMAHERSQGQDYATSGGVYRCTDYKQWQEFEQGGHVKGTAGYHMSSSQYQEFNSQYCSKYYSTESCQGYATGGSQTGGYFVQGEAARNWLSTRGGSSEVLTCGYLDREFAQSFEQKSGSLMGFNHGKLSSAGSADTSWSTDGIHANFALDFGQIKRSCKAVQDFGCL
jgi:hypothetical protein